MKNLIKLGREFTGEQTLMDNFGDIVFSQRIEQGLQQDELAEKASVESKIIHRIEGGSSVEIKELEKVMYALGLSHKEIGEAILSLSKEE